MQLKKDTYLQGGKYRVISTLGQGGFGITYLAEQVMAKRMVCIKEFFPKEYYNRDENSQHVSLGSQGSAKMMNAYKAKFIKEAQTIAKLKHPNIIPIFDVFEENNTAYYAMEYIEGESLNAKVKREGALAEDRAVKYIRDVASALRYIHKRNIMHLDVKPANVMLRKEEDSAILIDFGLSKQYDNAGKQTSATPVGISHGYAPMEQYQYGGVSTFSPVTDIYSLGATLYYLVTGRVPAEATMIGENGIGELPGHLSASVRKAITSAMSYWRKDRPQTIDIFLAMFDKATAEEDVWEVKEVDDATKVVVADTVITAEPVAPKPTTATPKSNYDDIYIKPKKPAKVGGGSKVSKQPAKRKSRWWLWMLILIIGVTAFFALRDGGKSNPVDTKLPTPPNNEIWYTSSDGEIVTPNMHLWEADILSNTYTNGKGIIEFASDITVIGEKAFYGCNSLTSITIPNSVTTISCAAFVDCYSLSSITIPNSVTKIEPPLFVGCDNLAVFRGKFASEDGKCLIVNNTLESFATGCGDITYNIPNNITSIGWSAFCGCDSLIDVTIPSSVESIQNWAFYECYNLINVYCMATTPPILGYHHHVFEGKDGGHYTHLNCTIYVPRESVEAYKSADGWNEYADQIVGYDF